MHGGTVRQTDQASYVEGSLITRCYDDEAATGGGVQFGTQGAECEPKTWSKTVKIQDKCVVRHDDKWWMNHKETWGKLIYIEDTQSYPTPNRNEIDPRIQLAQLGPMVFDHQQVFENASTFERRASHEAGIQRRSGHGLCGLHGGRKILHIH